MEATPLDEDKNAEISDMVEEAGRLLQDISVRLNMDKVQELSDSFERMVDGHEIATVMWLLALKGAKLVLGVGDEDPLRMTMASLALDMLRHSLQSSMVELGGQSDEEILARTSVRH